jgi:hypothetical protein
MLRIVDRTRRPLLSSPTGLAGVACAACCAIPLLLAVGVLSGTGCWRPGSSRRSRRWSSTRQATAARREGGMRRAQEYLGQGAEWGGGLRPVAESPVIPGFSVSSKPRSMCATVTLLGDPTTAGRRGLTGTMPDRSSGSSMLLRSGRPAPVARVDAESGGPRTTRRSGVRTRTAGPDTGPGCC